MAATTTDVETATVVKSPWRVYAPALGAALLFALALYALHHLTRDLHYRELVAEVSAIPLSGLLLALASTAAGYASLIGYDWSALRYIGRDVPPPRLAMASFCGYALGNTVGFAVLSGGAVRYRIYGALGLEASEIAAISVFCASAFGIGVTVVAFAALALHPDALAAVTSLPPDPLRATGAGGLAVAAMVLGLRSRFSGTVRLGRWTFQAPSTRLLLGQLGFSVLDIGFAAGALYAVLPDTGLPFISFVAIFAIASIAGVISHVPGGLGVFESVMIAGLGGHVPAPALAAGLVVYRAVYYLLPLFIAVLLLALNEVLSGAHTARLSVVAARAAPLGRAGSRFVPTAMSALVLVVGILLLLKGVLPVPKTRLEDVRAIITLEMFELSRLASSIVGAVLVVVSRALTKRVRSAFWIALGVVLVSSAQALLEGFDWELFFSFTLIAVLLWLCRREFRRPSRLAHQVLSAPWIVLIAAVALGMAWTLFFAHKAVPYSHELWWQLAFDAHAPRGLRAGLAGGVVLGLAALAFGLRTPWMKPHRPTSEELSRAAAVIRGNDDPDANFALVGDKALLFSESGGSFLMYGIQGHSWVALGAPVGRAGEAAELLGEFMDLAESNGGRTALYQVGPEHLPLCLDAGFTLNKLGEEAVVTLADFGLEGPARKDLRYASRRAERDGLRLELTSPPHGHELLESLRRISDMWLETKNTREKTFSLGRFDEAYLQHSSLALVREGERITAFANVLTTDTRAAATIDLMRHLPDTHRLTMDFLFIALMLELKSQGFGRFTLGMAPLSGIAGLPHDSLWNRLGGLLYRHAGHFYNFEGLRRFKEKFDPEWQPRYLATEGGLDPILAAADIALLCGGGLRGVIGR